MHHSLSQRGEAHTKGENLCKQVHTNINNASNTTHSRGAFLAGRLSKHRQTIQLCPYVLRFRQSTDGTSCSDAEYDAHPISAANQKQTPQDVRDKHTRTNNHKRTRRNSENETCPLPSTSSFAINAVASSSVLRASPNSPTTDNYRSKQKL